MTDLFAACAGLSAQSVIDAIPPSVRTRVERAEWTSDGRDAVLELGPWTPRAPVRHLLPSLALLTSAPYSMRFEISARRAGDWTPWIATATLGDDVFPPSPTSADGLTADIDEIHATPPVEAVRVRVRVRSDVPPIRERWLLTLSAWDGALASSDAADAAGLSVPARTQQIEPEAVRLRICSPTSLGMALEYFGRPVTTMTLADAVFHAATDRYGVWPAAVRTAAAHGIPGYLLRFADWGAAAWCLTRGLPIVASIRFAPGELSGSPLGDTTGHLVVVTGLNGAEVMANDPAAMNAESVPRRYDRAEFTRAWLEKSGVGYVFFPPA